METKAEVVKVYKQEVPALRFIGKKYGNNNEDIGKIWGDWWDNGWFEIIEKQIDFKMNTVFENGDATIGLMRFKENEPFEYWIGKFMPIGTNVPDGFEYRDFIEGSLGVCLLNGKWENLFGQEGMCGHKLVEQGYKIRSDNGAYWFFERYYGNPRINTPDGKGNFNLDICHFID
jgi:hypothetical protein